MNLSAIPNKYVNNKNLSSAESLSVALYFICTVSTRNLKTDFSRKSGTV